MFVVSEKNEIKEYHEDERIVRLFKTHEDYNLSSRRRAVFDMLRYTHFKKVLDLACGGGGYLPIKKHFNCVYYGLDISGNMIRTAKEKARELGIEDGVFFQQGEAEATPFDDKSFDLVLAICLIEYFENPDKLIEEIKRILMKDGVLIMQSYVPNPYVHSLVPLSEYIENHVITVRKRIMHKKYTKEQLDVLLAKNGFQLIDFAFSNFCLFPTTPLDSFFKKAHVRFSEYIARKDSKRFGSLAVNYIGKYRLIK